MNLSGFSMNYIKKSVLLFIAIILISVSVSARSFDAKFEAIENTINIGELAKFRLEIRNDLETPEMFKVRTLSIPEWELKTDPLMNPIQMEVQPGKKQELTFYINPNPSYISSYGVYDVSVLVELISKNEQLKVPLRVNIVSPESGTYVETVLANIIMDDKIDPTQDIPIRITLNNQNIMEYPEITVNIESNLIKDEIQESLGKREKKTISLNKKIDPQTPPQEDTIVVKLIANNKTLDTKIKRIEIVGNNELVRKEDVKKSFLKTVEVITLENTGNMEYTDGFKVESSTIQMLFTSSKPKGKFIKEDDQRYLFIPITLQPGESATIQITKNYITLLIIVALIAIIIGLYYLFRSPLTLQKKATNIAYKEGGVSELKVVLNVINRSKNKLKGIEIIDKIPNIADLEKGLTIGTLHPTKILKHERKGTIIKWFIEELEAGDERVISYKIKSHLSILGEFNLAPTVGKFKFKGKEIITHSNSLGINP